MTKKIFFLLFCIATTNLIKSSDLPFILQTIWGSHVNRADIVITSKFTNNLLDSNRNKLSITLSYPKEDAKSDFSEINKETIISQIKSSSRILTKSSDSSSDSSFDIKIDNIFIGKTKPHYIPKQLHNVELNLILNTNQVPSFIKEIAPHIKQPFQHKNIKLKLGQYSDTTDNIIHLRYALVGNRDNVPILGVNFDHEINTANNTPTNNTPTPSNTTQSINPKDPEPKTTPLKTTPKELHWLTKTSMIALPLVGLIGILLFMNKYYSFINLNLQSS